MIDISKYRYFLHLNVVFAVAVELDLQEKSLGFYIDGEYKDIAFNGLPDGPVNAAVSLYDGNASVIVLNQVPIRVELFACFCHRFRSGVALHVYLLLQLRRSGARSFRESASTSKWASVKTTNVWCFAKLPLVGIQVLFSAFVLKSEPFLNLSLTLVYSQGCPRSSLNAPDLH